MKKKQSTTKVELTEAELIVTIEAKYNIMEDIGDIDDCIERGLDSLRELGSAEVTSRRIVGVPKVE